MRLRIRSCAVALVMAGAIVSAATPKFTSVFKTPTAREVSFFGKKVAALVITKDEALRVAGEESLARELTARGMQGVATYRIAPREELEAADRARGWFERAAVEGVVALRPVSSDTRTAYNVETWSTPYYGSLWGYYGYGWSNVYVIGGARQETTVVVETTIYSVPRNALLWAGVSQTRDPNKLAGFIADLSAETIKELHKVGLAKQVQK
jgi:hypothetical protein